MRIVITICIVILLLVCCPVDMLDVQKQDILDDYNKYKKAAVDAENRRSVSKQLSENNEQYQSHVERLKAVNGFKAHNLVLRSGAEPDPNRTMYINNPVESKLPQAFLTLDEFKQALINRVKKNNVTLDKVKLKAKILKLWKEKRKRSKLRASNITVSKTIHLVNSTSSYAKKHRSKIIPNLLIEIALKLDGTVSTKSINAYSNKEPNKTTVPQVLVITNNLPSEERMESSTILAVKNPVRLRNQNVTEDISKIVTQTTTTMADENTNQLRSQNFTKDVLKMHAETTNFNAQDGTVAEAMTESKIDLETTEAITESDIGLKITEELTETNLDLKETEDLHTEVVTEATVGEDTIESTTVGTVPPTTVPPPTVSERVTLGRPAVYMGDADE